MRTDFAVFILSHGRAGRVVTLAALRNAGYTGQTYVLIDDEDEQADLYRESYGEMVVQFSKEAAGRGFDVGDTQSERRAVVYARNACFSVARDLGLTYFLELDDDFPLLLYRSAPEGATKARHTIIRNFDGVVEAMLTFLEESGALTVALAQGGDFIGGVQSTNLHRGLLRKAMNAFFLRVDRPVGFLGRLNEDVTTYVVRGGRGELFLTVTGLQVNQLGSQQTAGGMTDVYQDAGTYLKSFYTVMMAPSCVTVQPMGEQFYRLHHRVSWDHAVPKILGEEYRKAEDPEP